VATDGGEGDGDALLVACLGCEWVGLSLEEAADKAEAEGREWRDVAEGIDDDLRPGRVTFVVQNGIVVFASVEREGGGADIEGLQNVDDVIYLGLTLGEAAELAQRNEQEYCLESCELEDVEFVRLVFHTVEGDVDLGDRVVAVTRDGPIIR
jgi:hypothetical protein